MNVDRADLLLGKWNPDMHQGECRLFKFRPSHYPYFDEEKR